MTPAPSARKLAHGRQLRMDSVISSAKWLAKIVFFRPGPIVAVAVAIATTAAITAIRLSLARYLQNEADFELFFISVGASAFFCGGLAGAVAAFLGGASANFLFVPPIGEPPDTLPRWLGLSLFWIVSAILVVSVSLLREMFRLVIAAQERETLVAREMAHRVQNVLSIAQAMVRHTLRGRHDAKELIQKIEARFSGLAAAQDLALGPAEEITLASVVRRSLRPFAQARIQFDAEADCRLPADAAQRVLLALHELATNAIKYGALSSETGRVQVRIAPAEGGIALDWREMGGPPVQAPDRRGFGSSVIDAARIPPVSSISLDYRPAGLRCRFLVSG